ncbi:hypothetical protein [Rhizobium oryziradicis]|uniref:hypothetical protein n=1 Tax=Rhizobium oryziradicis TaxID=1867956 RepID=UPI000A49CADC|nr:hypothetical protein [Rhizobium oryziradicis]
MSLGFCKKSDAVDRVFGGVFQLPLQADYRVMPGELLFQLLECDALFKKGTKA